jgi:hypothetical protein
MMFPFLSGVPVKCKGTARGVKNGEKQQNGYDAESPISIS